MNPDSFEDARRQWAERSARAQGAGAQAFSRLLRLAEDGTGDQARRIARFIAATWDGEAHPLDLFELRAVDVAIADDMVTCIDALRWGKADLYKLVPDGEERVVAVLKTWGIRSGG